MSQLEADLYPSELLRSWDGESVVTAFDQPTATWVFIALHDTRPGPAVGGTRMNAYPRPEDGLRDAMRLAEGMSYKWAAIDFPFGGGKAVLALQRELDPKEREGLLRRYGRIVAGLRGSFSTGVDLGTTPEDMQIVADEAPYVVGVHDHGSEDPGPYTALGVLSGIRAAVRQRFGTAELAGRTVLIQGAGDVGQPLAHLLAEQGAELLVADLDESRAAGLAQRVGGTVVDALAVVETPCDVFAPCAVGAVLNPETIPRLGCAIVAGAANNQLESPADADRLHARGILYAPDYIVNAGGAIAFGRMHLGERDADAMRDEVRGIEETLVAIFREAEAANESPLAAARRRAERVLGRAHRGG